jgi:hypothetical protein
LQLAVMPFGFAFDEDGHQTGVTGRPDELGAAVALAAPDRATSDPSR